MEAAVRRQPELRDEQLYHWVRSKCLAVSNEPAANRSIPCLPQGSTSEANPLVLPSDDENCSHLHGWGYRFSSNACERPCLPSRRLTQTCAAVGLTARSAQL